MWSFIGSSVAVAVARDVFVSPPKAGSDASETVQSCVDGLANPGDRCLLRTGKYSFGTQSVLVKDKHGTLQQPQVIGAAGDGPVFFDGTQDVQELSVDGAWTKQSGNIYTIQLKENVGIYQLFAEQDDGLAMQILARWPNAGWQDKTMFMGPEHWAHSKAGGQHNYTTGKGVVYDAGACASASDCCADCNLNDLAASGVDATGSMAVLQLWANGVGFEMIKAHQPGSNKLQYTAQWCKAEVERRGKCADGYRNGEGKYYLEGALALLDAPHEWYFDKAGNTLYYYSVTGKPAAGSVRAKVSTHALNIVSSSHVTIANISFFATALNARSADDSINNLQFESLEFNYPAASKRALAEIAPEETVVVWTDDNRAVSTSEGKYPAWTNHTFLDVAFRFADGMALQFQGSGVRFVNCLWEWNSWTGNAASAPDDYGTGGTLTVNGLPRSSEPMFERVTLQNNGASKGIRPPHAQGVTIELCDMGKQLQLAWDGCMVETGGSKSARMTRNWCHDSGKAALRFDGDDSTGTANGEMSYNVVWNISGLIVKGDHHKIIGNTVFDAADIDAGRASSTYPGFQDEDSALDYCEHSSSFENPGQTTDTAGTHNAVSGNLMDNVKAWKTCTNGDCPFAGNWDDKNMIGSSDHAETTFPVAPFDVRQELRDPWNRDFRPCPGSTAGAKGAGAYPMYTGSEKQYWIPGAKARLASQPSPRDGASKAPLDVELMFLPAFRAVKHLIYFGSAGGSLNKLKTLHGDNNIVRPGLLSQGAFSWRVDAVFTDGSTRTGSVWTFSTKNEVACPATTHLSVGASPECAAAMVDCCGDVEGKGSKCMNHINRHTSSLDSAGCSADDEIGFCSTCNGLPLRNPGDLSLHLSPGTISV